jgi:hypothetical protein
MDGLMICPDCKGAKGSTAYACPGFRPIHIPCELCDATGEVTPEHAESVTALRAAGNAIRQERIERGESMRDAAKRRGLTVVEYSRIENGRSARP